MSGLKKGLIVGAVQLTLVLSLWGKLHWDRVRLPRVWVKTVAYDPELFIRGRYLSLRLQVKANSVYQNTPLAGGTPADRWREMREVELNVENGELVAHPTERDSGVSVTRMMGRDGEVDFLYEPVAFFLPEHAADPTRRAQGEELWMEVTVPKQGLPRPIRLAVKKGESFTPLALR